MSEIKRNYIVLGFLLVLVLSGCSEQNLTYKGASDNWDVVYTVAQYKDKVLNQAVDIQFIGEGEHSSLQFNADFPSSSCEANLELYENGHKQFSPGCLDEPRPNDKNDYFDVWITWEDQEEKVVLERE